MPRWVRWTLGSLILIGLIAIPVVHYRAGYMHSKRLRIVTPGVFLRSGQLSADGFREAIEQHGIRTVMNLQNEAPDPEIPASFYDRGAVTRESQLCAQHGVRYRLLEPDLIPPHQLDTDRPQVIDQFLGEMDAILADPAQQPVLLHCRAGLHRTGLLTAIYRMEYEGWSLAAAVRELRANGFGDSKCHTGNDYLIQYLQCYQPRAR